MIVTVRIVRREEYVYDGQTKYALWFQFDGPGIGDKTPIKQYVTKTEFDEVAVGSVFKLAA